MGRDADDRPVAPAALDGVDRAWKDRPRREDPAAGGRQLSVPRHLGAYQAETFRAQRIDPSKVLPRCNVQRGARINLRNQPLFRRDPCRVS
ncbi:unnamed protein product [Lampetra planeri]